MSFLRSPTCRIRHLCLTVSNQNPYSTQHGLWAWVLGSCHLDWSSSSNGYFSEFMQVTQFPSFFVFFSVPFFIMPLPNNDVEPGTVWGSLYSQKPKEVSTIITSSLQMKKLSHRKSTFPQLENNTARKSWEANPRSLFAQSVLFPLLSWPCCTTANACVSAWLWSGLTEVIHTTHLIIVVRYPQLVCVFWN